MNNIDFKSMDWKQRIDYFREIGIQKTYDISIDEQHPLCIDANDYFNEKNE